METFGRVAHGNWCAVCGLDESYGLDVHHVVSQQELKRRGLPRRLLWDVRNALPLCAIGGRGGGCHERHENASRRVPFTALKPENLEFAADVLGDYADSYLDRRYPGRPQRPNNPEPRLA